MDQLKDMDKPVKDVFGHTKYPRVVCKDGFIMSVQASEIHYCVPRCDDAEAYETVEIGYPSEYEPLLDEYMEFIFEQWDEEGNELEGEELEAARIKKSTDTVYGDVPASVVAAVIKKHGGMVKGCHPPLKHEQMGLFGAVLAVMLWVMGMAGWLMNSGGEL